jgi:hypothetical protein
MSSNTINEFKADEGVENLLRITQNIKYTADGNLSLFDGQENKVVSVGGNINAKELRGSKFVTDKILTKYAEIDSLYVENSLDAEDAYISNNLDVNSNIKAKNINIDNNITAKNIDVNDIDVKGTIRVKNIESEDLNNLPTNIDLNVKFINISNESNTFPKTENYLYVKKTQKDIKEWLKDNPTIGWKEKDEYVLENYKEFKTSDFIRNPIKENYNKFSISYSGNYIVLRGILIVKEDIKYGVYNNKDKETKVSLKVFKTIRRISNCISKWKTALS